MFLCLNTQTAPAALLLNSITSQEASCWIGSGKPARYRQGFLDWHCPSGSRKATHSSVTWLRGGGPTCLFLKGPFVTNSVRSSEGKAGAREVPPRIVSWEKSLLYPLVLGNQWHIRRTVSLVWDWMKLEVLGKTISKDGSRENGLLWKGNWKEARRRFLQEGIKSSENPLKFCSPSTLPSPNILAEPSVSLCFPLLLRKP